MIIILEGPDGSGKTTLARTLESKYGFEYHHEGPPPKDVSALTHYCQTLAGFRGRNVVIDRFAFGERIYGPLLRGRDQLGDEGWLIFQQVVASVQAFQVLCLPDYWACYAAWASGREELIKSEHIFRCSYYDFEAAARKCNQDFIYNYSSPDAERQLFEFVESVLRTTK